MKHLKLFEQDNWWENSTGFGEEESPEDELKVGDNVEILDNFDGGHLKIGSIGKVESISNSIYKSAMSYRVSGVSVDNYQVGHSSWQYYRSSLKKVE